MRSLAASTHPPDPKHRLADAPRVPSAHAPAGIGAPKVSRRAALELLRTTLRRERQPERGGHLTLVVGELAGLPPTRGLIGNWAAGLAFERLGAALEGNRRAIDTAVRLDDSRFALIAPEATLQETLVTVERVRGELHEARAGTRGNGSLRVGIAGWPEHSRGAADLMRAAGAALASAALLGPDASVVYSSSLPAVIPSDASVEARAVARRRAGLAALTGLLRLRDPETAEHSTAVGSSAAAIAHELGLPPGRVERVRLCGLLHDIGKIAVPLELLQSTSPITDESWEELKAHPRVGARMLDGLGMDDVRSWVATHHERPDGLGYPDGACGDEIPLEARIVAVADAWDAMMRGRAFRPALGEEEARGELERGAGTQFDRIAVEAFLRLQLREVREAGGAPA